MVRLRSTIVTALALASASCTADEVPVVETSSDTTGSDPDTSTTGSDPDTSTDTDTDGECIDDQDCAPGWTCVDGSCVEFDCLPGELDCPCDVGSTCSDGLACVDGVCTTCGNGMVEGDEECDAGADNGPSGACLDDCVINVCGDGFVGPGESCDDANDDPDDGCDECTLGTCGDGALDRGEQCDDGNGDNTDACTTSCTHADCGDGYLQPINGEDCDDGADNSDSGDCTSACALASCGDALIHDAGSGTEECDNGVANGPEESCKDDCTLNVCGDGFVGPGEACDDGNTDPGDGCSPTCALESCGNAVVDPGEQCDDGANGDDDDGCTDACLLPSCGDGLPQPMSNAEECDDGNQNADSAACTTSCAIATCGDGLVWEGNEQCDNGAQNDDAATCKSDCTDQICGDGFVGPGEGCDDANLDNADACTNACTLASCGDGFMQPGEQCDDGPNNDDLGSCTNACTLAVCGDGFVQMANGELCDAGNQNADDAACLTSCVPASCGDGFVWMGVEACDDGNAVPFDGCNPDCTLAGSFYGDDWIWEQPFPTGLQTQDMFGSSASDVWIAYSYGGTAHFDGNQWSYVPTPITQYLRTGWSAGPADAWVTAQTEHVMHWDGLSWTLVDSPAAANQGLYDIDGVASDEVYIVGNPVGLMRWDGLTWSSFPTGSTIHNDVVAPAPGDPWVSIYSLSEIWRLDPFWTDSGFLGASVLTMFDLGPSDIWIGGLDGELWRWNGNAYVAGDTTGLPATFDFDYLHGTDANTMWAVDGSLYGLREWDGAQWTLDLDTEAIDGIYVNAAADGWAGGRDGAIYRRDGMGWSQFNRDFTAVRCLADIAGELWVGGLTSVSSDWMAVARRDGGNWLDVTPPGFGGRFFGLWGDSPNNVWAVGIDSDDEPQVWWYDGNTWTEIVVVTTNAFEAVWGDGQGQVYIAGRNLYRWTGFAMQQVPIADTNFDDIHGLAPDDIWLAAGNRTWHYDGLTWSEVAVPIQYTIDEIHGIAPDDLWGAGPGGVLHWDGVAWQPVGLTEQAVDVYQRGPADVLVALTGPDRIAHWDGFGWTLYEQHGHPYALGSSQGVSYYGGTRGLLYQP